MHVRSINHKLTQKQTLIFQFHIINYFSLCKERFYTFSLGTKCSPFILMKNLSLGLLSHFPLFFVSMETIMTNCNTWGYILVSIDFDQRGRKWVRKNHHLSGTCLGSGIVTCFTCSTLVRFREATGSPCQPPARFLSPGDCIRLCQSCLHNIWKNMSLG